MPRGPPRCRARRRFPDSSLQRCGLPDAKLEWLADEIVAWVAAGDLVGMELLIVKNEKTIFHETFGWSNREGRRPMSRNSIFAVQSMTKPFTATAALMLIEEGSLALGDRVSRWVPVPPGDHRSSSAQPHLGVRSRRRLVRLLGPGCLARGVRRDVATQRAREAARGLRLRRLQLRHPRLHREQGGRLPGRDRHRGTHPRAARPRRHLDRVLARSVVAGSVG